MIHGLRAVLGCVPECVCVRVCVCALPMNSTISLNPLRHLPLSPSFTLELFRLPFFIFHPGERKKGKKKKERKPVAMSRYGREERGGGGGGGTRKKGKRKLEGD